MKIDVVMRCRNEMPFATRALDALAAQRGVTPRVVFFDCGSTDGSREEAERRGVPIVDVDPRSYRPGQVLNQGMAQTESAVVAFINADAVALDPHALEALVAPMLSGAGSTLGATFGRQEARAGSSGLTRLDNERAFGRSEAVKTARGAFFSMAASAISRRAWRALPFDEQLRYSEDVDWTTRLRALGFRVEYRPGARFEHAHEYTLQQHFQRRRGEGTAETTIFRLGPPSPWRELIRPLGGSLLRDVRDGQVGSLPQRLAQASGFFLGRLTSSRAAILASPEARQKA